MKRFFLTVAIIAMLVSLAGCDNSNIKIEGEEGPCDIYTYPSNNIFGLEKIVLFDGYAVGVFDVKKSDAGYVPIKELYKAGERRFIVSLENLKKSKIADGSIEKVKGKYIITARGTYDEADKLDSSLPVRATGMHFGNGTIICDENQTKLQYTLVDSEYTEIVTQEYSVDTGKWGKVINQSYDEPAMADE